MPRNRRDAAPSHGLTSTMTSALLIALAVGLSLLANIRLKSDVHRLETEIGKIDRALALRKRANEKLRSDYDMLISSAELDKRVEAMRLNLKMPGEGARVVLPEPPEEAPPRRAGPGNRWLLSARPGMDPAGDPWK